MSKKSFCIEFNEFTFRIHDGIKFVMYSLIMYLKNLKLN